jgi:hypothetical protein
MVDHGKAKTLDQIFVILAKATVLLVRFRAKVPLWCLSLIQLVTRGELVVQRLALCHGPIATVYPVAWHQVTVDLFMSPHGGNRMGHLLMFPRTI